MNYISENHNPAHLCRVQVTYSDRKNKHRITLERRYHVNITVLSSIELVQFFFKLMTYLKAPVHRLLEKLLHTESTL